jgi:hypothetical protein
VTTAWHEFCDTLKTMGESLLKTAPDEATRAEGMAYLARIVAYAVERFLLFDQSATNGLLLGGGGVAGSNPDFRYGSAPIQSSMRYRLRGNMNDAHRVILALYSMQPDGGFVLNDSIDFTTENVDSDGTMDIEISPFGSTGDGLNSQESTNVLLVRDIVLVKNGLRPDYVLESESGSAPRQFSAEMLLRVFDQMSKSLAGPTAQYLQWTQHFASQPNIIEPLLAEFDEKIQGDAGSKYWTGYFHLSEGAALLVDIPEMNCEYWGLMLANHWQEPLAGSFLNHRTSVSDPSGKTRVVISARDPGTGNWLSTEGRARGVIWHRRIQADNDETPRCSTLSAAEFESTYYGEVTQGDE